MLRPSRHKAAIPLICHCLCDSGNVLLRSFHRSGPGGMRCTRASRPLTMFVGRNFGRFLSQNQASSPCPNCQGWNRLVRLADARRDHRTGFSMQIRGWRGQQEPNEVKRLRLFFALSLNQQRAADCGMRARGEQSANPSRASFSIRSRTSP